MSDPHANLYVSPLWATAPFKPIAAGCTGTPEVMSLGGQNHTVVFTFTGRPSVGNTITVNGVVFTFIANGASPTGNQIALGASTLAQDITAMATALNASVVAAVALVTYTDAATTLTCVFDADGINSNAVFASNVAGATVAVTAAGRQVPALSVETQNTTLARGQTQVQTFSLPAGRDFQRKTIASTGASGGNMVVTYNASNTATFDAANEILDLMWFNGAWRVITNVNVTIA